MQELIEKVGFEKYTSYQDSGIEWLGEVPEHWEIKRLKYVFKILKRISGELGHNVLSITQNGIKVKDIESGEGQLSMDYSKYQIVCKGDFAMNHMDLLTGYVDISMFDGVISPDYRVFNLIHSNSDKKYILLLLQLGYQNKVFYAHGQGVSMLGRWRFPAENFNNFLFPIPPLNEQIAIANFSEKKVNLINKGIVQKEKQIQLLKERRQIIIHQAVTRGINPHVAMKNSGVKWIGEIPDHWTVKKIKNISTINKESLPEDFNRDFSFSYVDIGNVTLEDGITDTESFIFKEAPSRARRKVKSGDTIISTVRTYLKAIDFIEGPKSNYIYSTGFAVLEPNSFIYPEYLAYSVRSDSFTNQVAEYSKGTSYPAINSSELGRLFITYSGIEEQKQIVSFIKLVSQKISKAISCKQNEIIKLKEYKTTLINSAVTGKIKVS